MNAVFMYSILRWPPHVDWQGQADDAKPIHYLHLLEQEDRTMCNRYTPPRPGRILREFGVEPAGLYDTFLAPRGTGPFITPSGCLIGVWGLIPPYSPVPDATGRDGNRLSTNNCRMETMQTSQVFRHAWTHGQRCLIPADSWDEPYWGTGHNVWWRFSQVDGAAWALAGLWDVWTDKRTGNTVNSYTMITQPAAVHPVLSKMHRPGKEKRSVVPIQRADWAVWLTGKPDLARALMRLPADGIMAHGPADPDQDVELV